MKHLFVTAALALPTALTACAGFTPLNATPGGTAALHQLDVILDNGRDEGDRAAGFLIQQRMADRIAPNSEALYHVIIRPRAQRIGLGLTGQDFASRFDSIVTGEWSLIRTKDGAVVKRGRTQYTTSYSADRDPYRLLTASDDAVERAARKVADEILSEIALALSDQAESNAAQP